MGLMLDERASGCILPADRDLTAVDPPALLASSPGFERRGEVPLVEVVRDGLLGGGEIAFRTGPLLELNAPS
jgi:hypothetical protein